MHFHDIVDVSRKADPPNLVLSSSRPTRGAQATYKSY